MIISRYIIKEILYTFLAVVFLLLLIYLSNRFINYFDDVIEGLLPADIVITLVGLKMVSSLTVVLPLGLFLAILLAFGRFYKDSEMIVMAACGIGLRTIMKSVMGFSVVVALLVAAITFFLAPWAEELAYRIQDRERASAELTGIAAGRFTESPSGGGVFYSEDISSDRLSMTNVFIHADRGEKRIVLSAKNAYQDIDSESGERFMVLMNGYRYEGQPGDADYRIIQYERHGVRIQEREIIASERKHMAKSTYDLVQSESVGDKAELHWRIAMPLSAILLAVLAVPLSRAAPRQGRYAKLFMAIFIYVIYNNMIGVAYTWIERNKVSADFGMWWVHLGLLIGVFYLLARQYGAAWLFRSVLGKVPAS